MPVPPSTALWLQVSTRDSKMIVHPPQASLGLLLPGTPIEQDKYPGLKIMPIDTASDKLVAKIDAIPVQWPNLKVQAIPSNWPKLELNSVRSESILVTQPRGK
ncbi:MAG TPA: hypothetical protein VHZ52_10320 [Acidobacteriaceae bacterium]|nr:hypothetical protein [Acidobacteriaceae bacterium]